MRVKLTLFGIAAVLIVCWVIGLALKIAGFFIHILLVFAALIFLAGFLSVKIGKFRAGG